jgi:hypothetical protein
MRIAQIAPLAESVPPKLYGGTERVVAWLVDELVSLGHDQWRTAPPRISTRVPAGEGSAAPASDPPNVFRDGSPRPSPWEPFARPFPQTNGALATRFDRTSSQHQERRGQTTPAIASWLGHCRDPRTGRLSAQSARQP